MVGPAFKTAMENIAASLITVVKTVQYLIALLEELGKQFSKKKTLDVGEASKKALKDMADADKKAKDAAKNKTLAARPAEFGDVESVWRKSQLALASAGTGTKPVEESTADIALKAQAMFDLIQTAINTVIKPGVAALQTLAKAAAPVAGMADLSQSALAAAAAQAAFGPLKSLFGL